MFDLVYDVSRDYWKSDQWMFFLLFALLLPVAWHDTFGSRSFDIFGFPKPTETLIPFWMRRPPRLISGIALVLILLLFVSFTNAYFGRYLSLTEDLNDGCERIEGVVGRAAVRDEGGGVIPGSFSVGGVDVRYEHDTATRGFRESRVHLGPLREGRYARACYSEIGSEKIVLSLYLRRGA